MIKKVVMFAVALFAGAMLWAIGLSGASAQYPPEAHDIAVAASELTPIVGGEVSIAVTATSATGAPLADVDCSFSIVSQPGAGAEVDPTTATTNDNGIATTTLSVGSEPGDVVVEADCDGVTQTVTVTAQEPAAPPASEPEASPPASQPDLPAAGLGPDQQDSGRNIWLLAAVALTAMAGTSLAFGFRRMRS